MENQMTDEEFEAMVERSEAWVEEMLRPAVEEEFGKALAKEYFDEAEGSVDYDTWLEMSISDIVNDVDLYLLYS